MESIGASGAGEKEVHRERGYHLFSLLLQLIVFFNLLSDSEAKAANVNVNKIFLGVKVGMCIDVYLNGAFIVPGRETPKPRDN